MKPCRARFTIIEFIHRLLWTAIACTALLALSGCAAFSKAPTPSPTVPPTFTATPAPTLTATPLPTATSMPRPTSTPRPTATPRPISTPTLTPTPAPVCEGQTTAVLRLRAGPSTEHAHEGTLQEGGTIGILSRTEDGEWYRIILEDGAIHWVAAAYVDAAKDQESIPVFEAESAPDPSAPTPTGAAAQTPEPQADSATANVNLRAGPGTNYPIVGGLKEGDPVEIAGKTGDGGWYQVWRPDRSFAWVSAAYVQVNTDASAIPVVPASQIPPTPSPAPTATPAAPAVRPPTGMLEDYAPGGQGKLLVKNGTGADALVILTGLDDQAVKSSYIRGAEEFNMTGIHDGTYRLYYSKGRAFNPETNRFALEATYQRLDATIEFTTTSSQYTAWEVTLYGVTGGNVGSESVDPSQFP